MIFMASFVMLIECLVRKSMTTTVKYLIVVSVVLNASMDRMLAPMDERWLLKCILSYSNVLLNLE